MTTSTNITKILNIFYNILPFFSLIFSILWFIKDQTFESVITSIGSLLYIIDRYIKTKNSSSALDRSISQTKSVEDIKNVTHKEDELDRGIDINREWFLEYLPGLVNSVMWYPLFISTLGILVNGISRSILISTLVIIGIICCWIISSLITKSGKIFILEDKNNGSLICALFSVIGFASAFIIFQAHELQWLNLLSVALSLQISMVHITTGESNTSDTIDGSFNIYPMIGMFILLGASVAFLNYGAPAVVFGTTILFMAGTLITTFIGMTKLSLERLEKIDSPKDLFLFINARSVFIIIGFYIFITVGYFWRFLNF